MDPFEQAVWYVNKAKELKSLRKFEEALEYYARAWDLLVSLFGPGHISQAEIHADRGEVFYLSGAFREAYNESDTALRLCADYYGSVHHEVARNLNNRGLASEALGAFPEAFEDFVEAMKINEEVSGRDTPPVANNLLNIGNSLSRWGRFDEALQCYQDVLGIHEQHIHTHRQAIPDDLSNIGLVFSKLGNFPQALSCFANALAMVREMSGPGHLQMAPILLNMGIVYRETGQFAKALEYFNQGLEIYRNNLQPLHPEIAKTLYNVGSVYNKMAEYRKGMDYYLDALVIYERSLPENHPSVARLIADIGLCHDGEGDFLHARDCYEKALDMLHKTLGDKNPEVSRILANLSSSYQKQGDFARASALLRQAIGTDKGFYPGNHPVIAMETSDLGHLSFDAGAFADAMKLYSEALEMDRALYVSDHPDIARDLNNIGRVHAELHEYAKSLESYTGAMEIYRSVWGGKHPDIARVLNNMGAVYSAMGNQDEAIHFHGQALEMDRDIFGNSHPWVASDLNNLGVALMLNHEAGKAAEALREALSINQKFFGENHPQVAKNLNNLGLGDFLAGNYSEALRHSERSLAIHLALFGERHPLVAQNYRNIGWIYIKLDQYDISLAYFQSGLYALSRKFDSRKTEDNPVGEDVLNTSLFLTLLADKSFALSRAGSDLEQLRMAASAIDLAIGVMERSRGEFERQQDKIQLANDFSGRLFLLGVRIAHQLFEFTGDPLYHLRLYEYIERSKAAFLREGIREANAKEYAGIPADQVREEEVLAGKIALLSMALQKACVTERLVQNEMGKPAPERKEVLSIHEVGMEGEEAVAHFERRMDNCRRQAELLNAEIGRISHEIEKLAGMHDRMVHSFEHNFPEYHRLKFQSHPMGPGELQSLLKEDAAILDFFLDDLDGFVYTVCITKQEMLVKKLTAGPDFPQLVNNYVKNIKTMNTDGFLADSARLHELLIKPFEKSLEAGSVRELIILPDSLLYGIPFEALAPGEECIKYKGSYASMAGIGFLVNRFTVSYDFSATVWGEKKAARSRAGKQLSFMGMAPVFDEKEGIKFEYPGFLLSLMGDAVKRMGLSSDRKHISSLPASETEVREVKDRFENKHMPSCSLLREKATKQAFLENLKDYTHILLSTHGFYSKLQPELSGLVFYPGYNKSGAATGSEDSGDLFLYSGETYNLSMNEVELLVLSACKTAEGYLQKGEGLVSMMHGFRYSGASGIIGTLWPVDDARTKDFIVTLFGEILADENASCARALQRTKVMMIERGEGSADPVEWSPFMLFG